MLSVESRQLTFVFADNPSGGKDAETSDVSEGKTFLLHIANVKESSDSATRVIDDSGRLLERAASVANLARALLKVARNKGASGVDDHSVKEFVDDAPQLLPKLRRELLSGAYRPGDIRRVWIPKPGGGQRAWVSRMLWTGWYSKRYSRSWSRCSNQRFMTAATDFVPTGVRPPPLLRQRGTWKTDTSGRSISTCPDSSIRFIISVC